MSEENREDAAGEASAETKTPEKSIAETGVVEKTAETATEKTAETGKPEATAKPDGFQWPEDWRDKLSGGDDKLKGLLGRYTSPDAVAKAFKEQRDALAKKPAKEEVPDLPENPTDEQLSAWRKANGVPDKPEDYEFEIPEGKEPSDAEYEIMMDFAKSMHGKNMPAKTVKEISSWFLEYETVMAQRHADNAYKNRVDTEEKLRAEWGGDYKANINLMSNVLQEHLGSSSGDFLSLRLMDGSKIGDNETFIRLMADVSRKIGGSTAELYSTDVQTTATSLEERKAELLKMSTDPTREKEYRSPKIQDELTRIYAALARRAS